MVLYVKDKTGRFDQRPHYQPEELDRECEKLIVEFLRSKHKTVKFPVNTEDLKTLIERHVDELDCYADLSEYGEDVEGITEFRPGKKPIVRISARLTENDRLENRLRTTLTHEYGHVRFHAYLYEFSANQGSLFQQASPQKHISKRENILNAPQTDWMEWQAGYVCGAILMPASYTRAAVKLLQDPTHFGPVAPDSQKGKEMIDAVVTGFQVSQEAARIRLIKLGILGTALGPSLFSKA